MRGKVQVSGAPLRLYPKQVKNVLLHIYLIE